MELIKKKTACFSGYRHQKFDFPLNGGEYDLFTKRLLDEIMKSVDKGYFTYLFGGAPGFDIIAAEITVMTKRIYDTKDIKLVCVLPYSDFYKSNHFNKHWRERYESVMEYCHEIINVTGNTQHTRGCYAKRNEFMINNSSLLICHYTGKSGGTENTIKLAEKDNLEIINVD